MNPGMIKKLQKMQKEMVQKQKELEASTFYGSAGGKMVEVEFTGDRKMRKINIQPEALEDLDDLDIVQDTIVAAVNDCISKIDEETEEMMSKYTGGGMQGLL